MGISFFYLTYKHSFKMLISQVLFPKRIIHHLSLFILQVMFFSEINANEDAT